MTPSNWTPKAGEWAAVKVSHVSDDVRGYVGIELADDPGSSYGYAVPPSALHPLPAPSPEDAAVIAAAEKWAEFKVDADTRGISGWPETELYAAADALIAAVRARNAKETKMETPVPEDGTVSDVRVSAKAMSADEMNAQYADGPQPPKLKVGDRVRVKDGVPYWAGRKGRVRDVFPPHCPHKIGVDFPSPDNREGAGWFKESDLEPSPSPDKLAELREAVLTTILDWELTVPSDVNINDYTPETTAVIRAVRAYRSALAPPDPVATAREALEKIRARADRSHTGCNPQVLGDEVASIARAALAALGGE